MGKPSGYDDRCMWICRPERWRVILLAIGGGVGHIHGADLLPRRSEIVGERFEDHSAEAVIMKVVVNWPLCDGNGNCAKEAPEIFSLDESLDENDNLHLLKETFGEELRDKAKAAVRACPKNALRLEE
jgi:ferredoxin